MALTLSNLGIETFKPVEGYELDMGKYCVKKINGESINVSPQLILAMGYNLDKSFLDDLQLKLSKNMMLKKNVFLKRLKYDNYEKLLIEYINNYTKNIRGLNVILNLSEKSYTNLEYGESEFVKYNIQLLSEMLVMDKKVKNFLGKKMRYMLDNNVKDDELFKKFRHLNYYDTNIFDELLSNVIEYMNNEKRDDMCESSMPRYMVLLDSMYKKIGRIFSVKRFLDNNFPKKDYDDVYVGIYSELMEKDMNELVSNSNKYVNLDVINNLYVKMYKLLSSEFMSISKASYFFSTLSIYPRKILKKLKLKNINGLLRFYNNLNKSDRCEVLAYIQQNIDGVFFINILDTIISLNDENIKIFSSILNEMTNIGKVYIRLKHLLAKNIFKLDEDHISKLEEFINSIITFKEFESNINAIKTMISDKKSSDAHSMLIHPYKLFHFTKGVWDYPLNNEYFILEEYKEKIFLDELNAIQKHYEENKRQIIFSTKGKINMKLKDEVGVCNCEFIPAQAFIVKYIIDNDAIIKNELIKLVKTLNVQNSEQLINSIKSLLVEKDNIYTFVDKLPYYGNINFAEKYFSKTIDTTEDLIEKEYAFTTFELYSSNIIHILKSEGNKSEAELFNSISTSILKFNKINISDFNDIIKKLLEKDYIKEISDVSPSKYEYIVY